MSLNDYFDPSLFGDPFTPSIEAGSWALIWQTAGDWDSILTSEGTAGALTADIYWGDRQQLPTTSFVGNSVKLTLKGHSTLTETISGISIYPMTTGAIYDGDPARATFGGVNNVSISPGQYVTTDPITVAYDGANRTGVHISQGPGVVGGAVKYVAVMGTSTGLTNYVGWEKVSDDTMTLNFSYPGGTDSDLMRGVSKLEVANDVYVYSLPIDDSLIGVNINGGAATSRASLDVLWIGAENSYFRDETNQFYIKMASDPGSSTMEFIYPSALPLGTLTNYTKVKILNHILKVQSYSPATIIYAALLIDDPNVNKSEANYNGYNRKGITFAASSNRTITNNSQIDFDRCNSGTNSITHIALMNSITSGNILAYTQLNTPKEITANYTPYIANGQFVIGLNVGSIYTTYSLSILDWLFRHQTLNQPTNIYIAFHSSTCDDTNPGNELLGKAYARIQCNNWTTATSGSIFSLSSVSIFNLSTIFSSTATATWATSTYLSIFDSLTSGNKMLYGSLGNKRIAKGDNARLLPNSINISIS